MANMQLTKTPMAEQDPQVRNQNFLEVAQGYTLEEAMNEAKRCIHCKNPACVSGCPVGIPIPEFLDQVAQGNIAAAYEILSNANALPAISGRVCPQENQCEGKCVRGIKGEPVAIGRVERFVADWAAQQGVANTATAPKNGHKTAVIGSGPAGLTCAGELARIRDQYGPDSIGVLTSARCTNEENYLLQKLTRCALGTNNIDHCARL